MGKLITSIVGLLLVWGSFMGHAKAEGPLDIPSQSYSEVEDTQARMQLMKVSSNYIRAFSCNGGNAQTHKLQAESTAYNWIIKQGWKGYIQQGASGGQTLGVVLNDIKIDFSYSYLAKKGYSGNKASYVKGIQASLSCIGYNPGQVDGIFGEKTESAVKTFQRNKGLTVDGIVGKETYHYLSFSSS